MFLLKWSAVLAASGSEPSRRLQDRVSIELEAIWWIEPANRSAGHNWLMILRALIFLFSDSYGKSCRPSRTASASGLRSVRKNKVIIYFVASCVGCLQKDCRSQFHSDSLWSQSTSSINFNPQPWSMAAVIPNVEFLCEIVFIEPAILIKNVRAAWTPASGTASLRRTQNIETCRRRRKKLRLLSPS